MNDDSERDKPRIYTSPQVAIGALVIVMAITILLYIRAFAGH
jgi:hypothetical protein